MNIKYKMLGSIAAVVLLAAGCSSSTTTTQDTSTTPPADTTAVTPQPTQPTTPTPTTPAPTATTKSFTVTGANFSFTPTTLTVNKGDTVKIHFVNSGGFHDWVLDEFNVKTPTIQGGATADVQFVADKTGTFEYYCSVGDHRQMGMKGTLTVK